MERLREETAVARFYSSMNPVNWLKSLLFVFNGWLTRPTDLTWSEQRKQWITRSTPLFIEWTTVWKQGENGKWVVAASHGRNIFSPLFSADRDDEKCEDSQ